MYKLVLNVGDKVRNVNKYSPYKGEIGVVINEDKDIYYVRYQQSQAEQGYLKLSAHKHITRIEEPTHQCKCVPDCDEVCDNNTTFIGVVFKP